MPEDCHRPSTGGHRLVHIVDTDLATCEALGVVFRLEGFRTRHSTRGGEFLAAVEQCPPHVAIVNLQLGTDDVFALLRRLRTMRAGILVFALENRPEVEHAVMAMKAGAVDVLTKPLDHDRLLRGVYDALCDLPGTLTARALALPDCGPLTRRERQVLQLIAKGASNKEAGRELGISPRTIEAHRARVMEKLGARNAADLIRIVLSG